MTAQELLSIGLTNAALATLIAVAGWLLTRFWKNPHVASVVWLAVLLKLVTPPVVALPVAIDVEQFRTSHSSSGHSDPLSRGREVSGEGSPATSPHALQPSVVGAFETQAAIERTSDSLVPGPPPPREGERRPSQFAGNAAAEVSERDVVSSDADAAPTTDLAPVPLSLESEVPGGGRASTSSSIMPPSIDIPMATHAAIELAGEPLTPGPSSEGEGGRGVVLSAESVRRNVSAIVLSVWLAGTLLLGIVSIFRAVRFHRMLKQATAVDHEIQRTAIGVASRLGLQRCPAVRSVAANVGPMVWAGSLRPLVIVPRPLWDALGEHERETLLAHELAHVVRRDHWVRRFEAVVLALYWWLPTAWLAIRRREVAAESCCDALVLNHYPDRPQAYAEALLTAVSVLSTSRTPALASGLGRNHELKERLTMIVHDRVPQRPGRVVRWGTLLVATLTLAIGATLEPEHAAQASDSPPAAEAAAPEANSPGDAAAAVDEILFFHADWALHAQPMKQFFEKRRQEGLPIRLIDATGKPEVMRANNVESIPTIVFLKNGKEVDRRVGMADDERLRELLANHPTSGNGEGTEYAAPASDTPPAAEAAPAEAKSSGDAATTIDEILFFHASWAVPSQTMMPLVEELRQEGLPFRIVDVDLNPELAKASHVTTIPAFVTMRNGKEIDREIGVMTEKSLREFARRHPLVDRSDRLSLESRKKIIDGLIAVVQDEKQSGEVQAQAMRSLSSLAKGTVDENRVETVLTQAAEQSDDLNAKLGAADALNRLGSDTGVELLWQVLETTKDVSTLDTVVPLLRETNAAVQSAKAMQVLAVLSRMGNSTRMEQSRELLQRSVMTSDGIRGLTRAIETAESEAVEALELEVQMDAMPGVREGSLSEDQLEKQRELLRGKAETRERRSSNSTRNILLKLLADAVPTSDEIAGVLVETLSHNDADIRKAAAKALGNTVPEHGGYGMEGMYGGPFGMMGAGGSRAMPMGGGRDPFFSGGGAAMRGGSRGGSRLGMPIRPREPSPFGLPPEAVAPFAPRSAGVAPGAAPIDDPIREELLEPLIAAGQDEQATPESRIAALTALAKLSTTKAEKERAADVVKAVLEQVANETERRELSWLLFDLTDGRGGRNLVWPDSSSVPKEEAGRVIRELNARGIVPPDAEAVANLAKLTVLYGTKSGKRNGIRYEMFHNETQAVLDRLTSRPEGIEKLIDAIAIAKEPSSQERGENAVSGDTPVRSMLLEQLSSIRPTSPDVAKVLADALSHTDPAIRTAAATALGNYRPENKANGER